MSLKLIVRGPLSEGELGDSVLNNTTAATRPGVVIQIASPKLKGKCDWMLHNRTLGT